MSEILKKTFQFFYDRPLAILFIFFFISVIVRLPNLNRPLSKHHELNAALVLINAEEWNNKTAAFYKYVPVHSYHQPGDDVYNERSKEGYKYLVNVSFGALWYIMPYQFFRLLHQEPSPLLLQVLNLLLHLVTVVLIYHLSLYSFKSEHKGSQKALLTSVFYMFSPSPLWFHGNGYVHEVAVLPFIYGAILLYISIRQGNSFKLYPFLLSIIIAGICCDWLMCFVAAAMFMITLTDYIKQRLSSHLYLLTLITCGVLGGLLITFWQFSAFMGAGNYFDGLLSRFLLRGIKGSAEGGGLSKGTGIVSFYFLGYGLQIPLVIFSSLFITSFKKHFFGNTRLKNFILIASVVCLFHHLLFWGFSNIHDYAVIKAGIIICLLSTIAISSMHGRKIKIAAILIVILLNTGIYYYINPPGIYAANGQPYSYFKDLGEQIKTVAKPGDYIFIDTPEMSLLLTYYSKRFYRNVKDLNEAQLFFKSLPGKNALYFHTSNFKFVHYTRLKKQ